MKTVYELKAEFAESEKNYLKWYDLEYKCRCVKLQHADKSLALANELDVLQKRLDKVTEF